MFICKKCKVEKSAEEYRVHRSNGRVWRDGTCKQCEREYQRKFYAKGGALTRKRKRDFMAKRRAENPEAVRKYNMTQYYKNHEENKARGRRYALRRFFWNRIMHMRQKGKTTAAQLSQLWKLQRGRCALTGRRLDRSAQLDHIMPLARGGNDVLDNLRWVCKEVNIMKRHMTDAELFTLCREIIERIDKCNSYEELKK